MQFCLTIYTGDFGQPPIIFSMLPTSRCLPLYRQTHALGGPVLLAVEDAIAQTEGLMTGGTAAVGGQLSDLCRDVAARGANDA